MRFQMDIFVNGIEIDYAHPPLTWGDFYNDWLAGYIEKNHAVVSILVDKTESLNVIAKDPRQSPPGDIKKIEVFTKDTFLITKDGFVRVLALTDSIRCEIPIAAGFYRKGQTIDAAAIIKKIMVSIPAMIDFVNSVGLNYSLNFDEIPLDREITLKKGMEFFLNSFSHLVEVKKRRDNDEIANYLEQQFLKAVATWSKTVKKLLRKVSELSPK